MKKLVIIFSLLIMAGMGTANIFFDHSEDIVFKNTDLDMDGNKIKNVSNLGNGTANASLNLSEPIPGDVDNNGIVNFEDLSAMAEWTGEGDIFRLESSVSPDCTPNLDIRCDLDNSGDPNFGDLVTLYGWLTGSYSYIPTNTVAAMKLNLVQAEDLGSGSIEGVSVRGGTIKDINRLILVPNKRSYQELENEYNGISGDGRGCDESTISILCVQAAYQEWSGDSGSKGEVNGEPLRFRDVVVIWEAFLKGEGSAVDIAESSTGYKLNPVTMDSDGNVPIFGDLKLFESGSLSGAGYDATFKSVSSKNSVDAPKVNLEKNPNQEVSGSWPDCTSGREGSIRYSDPDNTFYGCTGNGWEALN